MPKIHRDLRAATLSVGPPPHYITNASNIQHCSILLGVLLGVLFNLSQNICCPSWEVECSSYRTLNYQHFQST